MPFSRNEIKFRTLTFVKEFLFELDDKHKSGLFVTEKKKKSTGVKLYNMEKRLRIKDKIIYALSIIVTRVRLSNKLNLTDINIRHYIV